MKKLARALCLGAFVLVLALTSGCAKSGNENEKEADLLALVVHHLSGLFLTNSSTPNYARYGDYLSTQMVTNRSFGYGMFVCEFQAAPGPTCSTFWLYSNEPSVRQLPDIAQNWRWNEIDFEFVPFTNSTQAQYYTFNGGLPNPTQIKKYGTSLNFGDSRAQVQADAAFSWTDGKLQIDDIIAQDMFNYYNLFLTPQKGGPPTGGTFTLKDMSTDDVTAPIAWSSGSGPVKAALDALNGGKGLFSMKDKYTVSQTACGGPGTIDAGSLNIIQILNSGLTPQLAAGMTVTSPAHSAIIPGGTTIVFVDTVNNTVTLNQDATTSATNETFNFVSAGAWSVTFTTEHPDPAWAMALDYSSMLPAGILGNVIAGHTPDGTVTNMNISMFQPYLKPAGPQTWFDLLVQNTPLAGGWADATQWKYPLGHIKTPDDLDISKKVTMNFWRSPAGNKSIDINFGNWGNPVTHTSILRESPIPGVVGHPSSFTSAVLNNEAYVFDRTGEFDPASGFHTYTIVWTRTRMAQYIDAPDRGRDIFHATPITEYKIADFPSMSRSGPQAPGANIPWIGTELNQPIGNVTMNLANYVAFQAASMGNNNYAYATGALKNGSASVTGLSIQNPGNPKVDLKNRGISGQGIAPGTIITNADTINNTLTLDQQATIDKNVSLIMGLDTLPGTYTDNVTISFPSLDQKKVTAGQLILGKGIPDGTKVKSIDTAGKTVTIDQKATTAGGTLNFVFQTTPSGDGWSGPPPGSDFTYVDAYVRSVGFFPLIVEGDGLDNTDFQTNTADPATFWADFTDAATWTADTFTPLISKYFSLLYARNYTSENAIPGENQYERDATSPMNLSYQQIGGMGCMRLRCSLSTKEVPLVVPDRNFFVLQGQVCDAEISGTNPLVRVEIMSKDDADQYYAATSSVTTPSAFFAPTDGNVVATIQVWVSSKGYYDPVPATFNYSNPAPDHTATITLHASKDGKSCYWDYVAADDPDGVLVVPSAVNPHIITVHAPGFTVCP